MERLFFEWDSKKDIANIEKHQVSFSEAQTVFYDQDAIMIFDEGHSEDEDRFLLLGMSSKYNILIVCHCYRFIFNGEEHIRIISARKADKEEARQYFER